MKKRLISGGCWIGAILLTFALAVVATLAGVFSLFALVTIIWAILDSRRVDLRRYHTGISGGPSILFVLLLIFGWPIVFPWYLGMRFKIMAGTARLRDEYQPWSMSDPTVGPKGLVQPWRGRGL
jgi:hypothetical protein